MKITFFLMGTGYIDLKFDKINADKVLGYHKTFLTSENFCWTSELWM